MRFRDRMIVFDTADIEAETSFWAGLLDGTVQGGDQWRNIWTGTDWQLGVQRVPDHVPPEWPDGAPQQVHLDFYVPASDALDEVHDQVIALGGRLLKAAPDRAAAEGFQVYASPAGHPFCVCWRPANE
jgi:glyoxalase superfamily protein